MNPFLNPKLLLLLAATFTLAAVSSCAKKNEPAPSPTSSLNQARSAVQVQPVNSLPEAIEAISTNPTLRCASSRQCPGNVGLLLAADSAGGFVAHSPALAACTATLIGDDLALTNSHCIPSSVKLLPDLCSERVKLVLPRSQNNTEERFSCRELLGFSERATPMSPDLALIRLDHKTRRTPVSLDRNGVADATPLRLFKVNPNLQSLTGVLVTTTCQTTANSYRMPVYKSAEDSTVVLGDCAALPGNSGSPILNQKGQLVALLQADLPISNQANSNWAQYLDSPTKKFARLAMGTSLRCLAAEPLDGWRWNQACATITEIDVAVARPRIRQFLESEKLSAETAALLKPFLEQSSWLNWKRQELETKALSRKEILVPSCYKEGTALPAETKIEMRIPVIELELRFNRYLQVTFPQAKLAEVKIQNYELKRDAYSLIPLPNIGEEILLTSCEEEARDSDQSSERKELTQ